jgi:transposase
VDLVQLKGKIKTVVVPDNKSKTVLPIVDKTVEKGSQIYTDEYPVYAPLTHMGYNHDKILHS